MVLWLLFKTPIGTKEIMQWLIFSFFRWQRKSIGNTSEMEHDVRSQYTTFTIPYGIYTVHWSV